MIFQDIWFWRLPSPFDIFRKVKTPDYGLQLVFFGRIVHEWFG